MLYAQQDYKNIKKLNIKIWGKMIIASLVFIAAIVICSIYRIGWPGYAAAAIWGISITFIWGTQGSRAKKYSSFLIDIQDGLKKDACGTVDDIDTSITNKDEVDFYMIIFKEDGIDPDATPRKLYFDAAKGIPKFKKGDKLELKLFGNNIIGFKKI